jgi:hypothetical protein
VGGGGGVSGGSCCAGIGTFDRGAKPETLNWIRETVRCTSSYKSTYDISDCGLGGGQRPSGAELARSPTREISEKRVNLILASYLVRRLVC